MDKLNIGALTLITSCGCNLNCNYCHIAQAVNADAGRLQQATIQALKDGSFLNNVQKVLQKLNQSSGRIGQISLWGQEPTLTLHHITEHMEDWFEVFPNLQGLMFSTNGINYGERIVDFVKAINKYTKKHFSLEIQFSFDGTEGTENIRNGNSKNIYNTITYVLNELNKIHFDNMEVHAYFHGVLSKELLYRLDTFEKIQEYYKNLNDWGSSLASINLNKNVHVDKCVGIALENPIDASTEDGLKLAEFIKRSIRINPDVFKAPYGSMPASTLTDQYNSQIGGCVMAGLPVNDLYDIVDYLSANRDQYLQAVRHMSNLLYCGNSYGELKLMYDGTIINCQNSIYDRDLEYLKAENDFDEAVKKSFITHHYYINPLTDDEKIIQNHFDLFRTSKEDSFGFIFDSTINQMYWLLQAHQIDESYLDSKKMILHGFLISFFNCCYYNNYVKTGSMYLRTPSFIRLFCNGFLDEILAGQRAWEKGEKI